MKAKLTVIVVLALLATGAAHAQRRDDGPRSSGAIISNVTEISNDIHAQGYGLALGFMPFSLESSVAVNSTQSNSNDSVDLRRDNNAATVGGQTLKGAQGAVRVDMMSGAGSVQSGDVTLVAVDAGKVFISAQTFNNQTGPDESLSIGSALNKASLGGNALNGIKDTIGTNITAGVGRLQGSGMAASTNTSGRIAKTTDYDKRSADDNSLCLNGYDPINVASPNDTALMSVIGNAGANITIGAGNLQHNGLIITTAKAAN